MKRSVVVILIILFTGYYWYHRILSFNRCVCASEIETLNLEKEVLKKEKKMLDQQIIQLKHRADSLMQKANEEKEVVTQLKKKQHERIKAIDHATEHELVLFFAKLEASSSTNGP